MKQVCGRTRYFLGEDATILVETRGAYGSAAIARLDCLKHLKVLVGDH